MRRTIQVSCIAVILLGISAFPSIHAQSRLNGISPEESALLKMASNGFRLGRKMHPPLEDTQSLLKISTGHEKHLHELSRLILLRDLTLVKKGEAVERSGEEIARAQEVVSKGILNSAGRQSAAGLFDDGLDVLGELQQIARDAGSSPSKAYSAMTDQYKIAKQGVVIEGLIGDSVLRLLKSYSANPIEEKAFRLRPTYTQKSDRPFSCFKLANKTDEIISWAVIILRLDCEFAFSRAEQNHTATGEGLGRILFGDMVPNYSGRLKAREAYANTDKSAVYFVQDWGLNQELQMVSLPADEYYQTVESANVQIITAEGTQEMEVDVEKHRKLLKLKFDRPQSRRRR